MLLSKVTMQIKIFMNNIINKLCWLENISLKLKSGRPNIKNQSMKDQNNKKLNKNASKSYRIQSDKKTKIILNSRMTSKCFKLKRTKRLS